MPVHRLSNSVDTVPALRSPLSLSSEEGLCLQCWATGVRPLCLAFVAGGMQGATARAWDRQGLLLLSTEVDEAVLLS